MDRERGGADFSWQHVRRPLTGALRPRQRRHQPANPFDAVTTALGQLIARNEIERVELTLVTLLAVVILPFGIGWWVGHPLFAALVRALDLLATFFALFSPRCACCSA